MDGAVTSDALFPVVQPPTSGDGSAQIPQTRAFTSFNVEEFRSQTASDAMETTAEKGDTMFVGAARDCRFQDLFSETVVWCRGKVAEGCRILPSIIK
jgi:hypothetical protein